MHSGHSQASEGRTRSSASPRIAPEHGSVLQGESARGLPAHPRPRRAGLRPAVGKGAQRAAKPPKQESNSGGNLDAPSHPSRSQPQPRLPAPVSPHRARWSPDPPVGTAPVPGVPTCGYLGKPAGTWQERRARPGAAPQPRRDAELGPSAPLSARLRPARPGPAGAGGGRGPGGRAPPAVAAAPAPLPSDPGQNFSAAGKEPGGRGCPGRAAPRFTPAAPLVKTGIEPSPEHPGAGRAAPGTAPADLFPPQPVRSRSSPSLSRDAPG